MLAYGSKKQWCRFVEALSSRALIKNDNLCSTSNLYSFVNAAKHTRPSAICHPTEMNSILKSLPSYVRSYKETRWLFVDMLVVRTWLKYIEEPFKKVRTLQSG